MSDFVNRTVKVFDLLTLTVLMSQGDLDYTMVEYWDCTRAYRPGTSNLWTQRWPEPPVLRSCCLACLCKRQGHFADAESNRTMLLYKVKAGNIQIARAWLRTTLTQCDGCGVLPSIPINPNWLDTLL